ncbi:alpha/beta fold hydrolase [Brucella intermedia]|uniref:alpha/beta fold hydrolase n=1 Tax=Brucella intermedia TaxID=94625 RepID=UPI00224B36AB|nr:alpha/beta hydrolase [Brucella intermedia]
MAILFVPGFMLDAELWHEVEPMLRVYGPAFHADLSKDASIADMARRALAGAPSNFVLIGFSMGGYVAREIVRQAPERVSALILIATSAREGSAAQARRKAAVGQHTAPEAFKGLSTAVIRSSLHPDNADREDIIFSIQAMSQRLGLAVFERQSLLVRRDERGELGSISCPSFVIAGDRDRLRSRAEAIELHQGLAGSAFAVVEGVGHMIPLEAPRALSEIIIDWLSEMSR